MHLMPFGDIGTIGKTARQARTPTSNYIRVSLKLKLFLILRVWVVAGSLEKGSDGASIRGHLLFEKEMTFQLSL